MGLRLRWGGVGRGAAVVAAGLLALWLLARMLAPPGPEPLPADVGLPPPRPGTAALAGEAEARVAGRAAPRQIEPAAKAGRRVAGRKGRSAAAPPWRAGGRQGRRQRGERREKGKAVEAPAAEEVPAGAPPVAPAPAAEAAGAASAPTPVDDGSAEFAPR